VKPLTVEIMNPLSTLTADQRYELTCESTGSRPNAIITWYKGKRQLRKMKVRKNYMYKVCKYVIIKLPYIIYGFGYAVFFFFFFLLKGYAHLLFCATTEHF
jgi:hypothetical protein